MEWWPDHVHHSWLNKMVGLFWKRKEKVMSVLFSLCGNQTNRCLCKEQIKSEKRHKRNQLILVTAIALIWYHCFLIYSLYMFRQIEDVGKIDCQLLSASIRILEKPMKFASLQTLFFIFRRPLMTERSCQRGSVDKSFFFAYWHTPFCQ